MEKLAKIGLFLLIFGFIALFIFGIVFQSLWKDELRKNPVIEGQRDQYPLLSYNWFFGVIPLLLIAEGLFFLTSRTLDSKIVMTLIAASLVLIAPVIIPALLRPVVLYSIAIVFAIILLFIGYWKFNKFIVNKFGERIDDGDDDG